ncbi:hypothetical protein E3N88_18805 [Mikania micrantha]|uniref:Ty3 transposon capsid-like protein domain-containing protein n=1 Tax=Mikania micrantha TaxID=192012 RepID=A0A5N6NMV3_9ASTR|nr:hypothetical protein E3N88_18805 [Mikania micrantha]
MAGGRFRELLKKYGKVALVVHCSVSAASITGLYVAINNNVDVEAAMERLRFKQLETVLDKIGMGGPKEELDIGSQSNQEIIGEVAKPRNRTAELAASSGGAFALAVLCNKALFPVRVPITIALTPPIARVLARRKIINSPILVEGGTTGETSHKGCSYKSFVSCKPKDFHGTEGAIGILKWIEKMESVISISDCLDNQKVKYATRSFQNKALTWWNTQVQARGREAVEAVTWEELKAILVKEYCPKNEMQKLEEELWNHQMIEAEDQAYTNRFHELSCLLPHMVPSEAKKIDRYIWGLTPQIRGMVTSAEPTTLEKAILLAASLTDEMVRTCTLTKKQAGGKRKRMEFQGKKTNNDARKDHGTTKNFVMATTERKPYNGPLPKCNKCNYHHHGNCNVCNRCKNTRLGVGTQDHPTQLTLNWNSAAPSFE